MSLLFLFHFSQEVGIKLDISRREIWLYGSFTLRPVTLFSAKLYQTVSKKFGFVLKFKWWWQKSEGDRQHLAMHLTTLQKHGKPPQSYFFKVNMKIWLHFLIRGKHLVSWWVGVWLLKRHDDWIIQNTMYAHGEQSKR